MNKKIRQTFYISDMIDSLRKMSEKLEDDETSSEEGKRLIDTSTQIGLLLMAGYPQDYFLPHEINFIAEYMKKLSQHAENYGDYDEF